MRTIAYLWFLLSCANHSALAERNESTQLCGLECGAEDSRDYSHCVRSCIDDMLDSEERGDPPPAKSPDSIPGKAKPPIRSDFNPMQ